MERREREREAGSGASGAAGGVAPSGELVSMAPGGFSDQAIRNMTGGWMFKTHNGPTAESSGRKLTRISESQIKVGNLIGAGGFANVYLADYLGTPVVVKRIKPQLNSDLRSMFIAETQVMAGLSHPNIIQLIGIIEEPFSLVMEYMDKGSVRDLLKKEGSKIGTKKRFKLLRDAARGMNYLHSMRVIHGDMKPLNLMVDEDLRCKVGDFGLAVVKAANVELQVTGVKIFTPAFAAPEMFSQICTPASDVFSFASTIYYVLIELINLIVCFTFSFLFFFATDT